MRFVQPRRTTVGDGCPATQAKLAFPTDAVPIDDDVLIADASDGARIRKVSFPAGTISTVAGGGQPCATGDNVGNGCPATEAILSMPTSALPRSGGSILIAELNSDTRAPGRHRWDHQQGRRRTSGAVCPGAEQRHRRRVSRHPGADQRP